MDGTSGLSATQLARVLDLGRSLVSELRIEPVLGHVIDAARELTGARYAALGILDSDGYELERFLFVGLDEEARAVIGPLPRGKGLLGELIRHPATLRLDRIADHPSSYGFPPGHPPMTSFLGTPVRIRGNVYGNLYLTDKVGASGFTEADEHLIEVLAQWAAIAIDNARAHEASERRRGELERAVKALRATVELIREIEPGAGLDAVREVIVARGRELVDARAAALLLVGEDGAMRVAGVAGECDAEAGSVVEATAMFRPAVRSGASCRHRGPEAADVLNVPFRPHETIVAPLRSEGRTIGVLLAVDPAGGGLGFARDDELLLASFAAGAAGALASARAAEDERLTLAMQASELERRRWARELHDETLQELGALRVAQHAALASADAGRMRDALAKASEQVDRLVAGLEDVINDLRPAALDQLGVAAAIEALAERSESRFAFRVSIDVDLDYEAGRTPQRHPPELEATIYRVVQEALSNAGKHARAEHVRVAVDERDGVVTVTVADDGTGIVSASQSGGFGLVGMRERVALAGGGLQIGAGPHGGTRVVATIPVGRA